ncbi:MAG: hypothetical protein JWM88_2152 [Verrucomicrobia bacterium]|nr:hypothetical protein [Verrucomicrobiota bacterium]
MSKVSLRLALVLAALLIVAPGRGRAAGQGPAGAILLPGSAASGPFQDAVLFSFDELAFPFRNNAEIRLYTGQKPRLVLLPGPAGSHDEAVLYYGTVIRIGDTFHMWYNGNYGPMRPLPGFEREKCVLAYATSKDGVHWEKPELNLVEFNGSKRNNIVDFPVAALWSTCAILHDPEDPDSGRRFKMAYEARYNDGLKFCVAFSPDGLHWTPSARNPIGQFLEMAGVAKHQGLYYVNGQATLTAHHAVPIRRLVTFVSSDFETWSPAGAVGLDRGTDLSGPSSDDRVHQYEEVHLGAALWNRGNVLLGIYGMWHGNTPGDRRLTGIDLGLALTHDGIHYIEPIRDFRLIPAREQPESPVGVIPALMQGQGMENVGDETLYWYSLWRGNTGSGVRLVTWPRDRIGAIAPFKPTQAQAITCPVQVTGGDVRAFLNVGGLGEYTSIRVSLLDEGFHPVPGYSGNEGAVVTANGFRTPVPWKNGAALPISARPFHLQIEFVGVRPEDARLYALYLSQSAAQPAAGGKTP